MFHFQHTKLKHLQESFTSFPVTFQYNVWILRIYFSVRALNPWLFLLPFQFHFFLVESSINQSLYTGHLGLKNDRQMACPILTQTRDLRTLSCDLGTPSCDLMRAPILVRWSDVTKGGSSCSHSGHNRIAALSLIQNPSESSCTGVCRMKMNAVTIDRELQRPCPRHGITHHPLVGPAPVGHKDWSRKRKRWSLFALLENDESPQLLEPRLTTRNSACQHKS